MHARTLVELDVRRPRQVNLRRAISDAYYALFHLLIDAAVTNAVGPAIDPPTAALRHGMARWYGHAVMKEVANNFQRPALAAARELLTDATGLSVVSPALARVANTFVRLQEERHRADYDLAPRYTRTAALALVQMAEAAFADWRSVSASPHARLFLSLLLTGFKVIPQQGSGHRSEYRHDACTTVSSRVPLGPAPGMRDAVWPPTGVVRPLPRPLSRSEAAGEGCDASRGREFRACASAVVFDAPP
jgi:hypothetical protein